MASVCFYFQVHQPNRLRRYSVFDSNNNYFDDYHNEQILKKDRMLNYEEGMRIAL